MGDEVLPAPTGWQLNPPTPQQPSVFCAPATTPAAKPAPVRKKKLTDKEGAAAAKAEGIILGKGGRDFRVELSVPLQWESVDEIFDDEDDYYDDDAALIFGEEPEYDETAADEDETPPPASSQGFIDELEDDGFF
ncbi:hypothetical protein [Rothia sp. ZJ932]|uniref:hypothetical protein n=1 Tax=Rothia sp. ZJ932 TaxID=2810516 RepID=UPI001966DF40|nr:hypothetical protein [Rothia sp. ZJ932]QRZ61797.1 hypothetical protein JR346_01245 [Rothia sp. ZJ932]